MPSEREPLPNPNADLTRGLGRTRTTGGEAWLTIADTAPVEPPLIEGGFTHDALPDLFRYLSGRGESLLWELTTLAGSFMLVLDHGEPVDIMFRPVRPVGALVGLKALQILFRQEGGRFSVRRGTPDRPRRSLNDRAEQLLIQMATLDDEAVAPSVLAGRTVDVDDELRLVSDVALPDHQTAFRTRSLDVPLTEVLQLFSVSRRPYWIQLLGPAEQLIGRLHLDGEHLVVSAEYGTLRGGVAFTALLTNRKPVTIDVRPIRSSEQRQLDAARAASGSAPLGKLDALLMQEFLSGRLAGNLMPEPEPEAPVAQIAPEQPASAQAAPQATAGSLLSRVFGGFRRRDGTK
ncbi:hypothetical protein [Deinococcus sonorensis]|uniref:DUF4388 domain-containing protein n=2 Tax=Deinococcus sonorensis TaxID=309891 RepID=A0AAU7U7M5_9DEIO